MRARLTISLILSLLLAATLAMPVASAQDNEAMRKQFRQLGVPEAEIDRMLTRLDDKLKESGASDVERTAILSQRQRAVKVHLHWEMNAKPFETGYDYAYACVEVDYPGAKKHPPPSRLSCHYRLSGETTVPAELHYLPLAETERIARSPKADRERATAVLGIQTKLPLALLPTRTPASVTGKCTAPDYPYPCPVVLYVLPARTGEWATSPARCGRGQKACASRSRARCSTARSPARQWPGRRSPI